MEAVVCTDFNDGVVEKVPDPEVGSGEVLVEIERVQLSVTECNLYRGEKIAHYETVADRLSDGPAQLFGHEFCGIVRETAPDVTRFTPGERVFAPGKIPCGSCAYCRNDRPLRCTNKTYIGYDIPGALAEYAVLPVEPLNPVPSGVSNAEAAALQPLASTVLCVMETGISLGDRVAVIGCGVMGFQCAQLAAINGATDVFVIDINQDKLDIAAEYGFRTINAGDPAIDPVEIVRSETDGLGVDIVFEAVGGSQSGTNDAESPLAQALDMVTRGGTISQIGYIIGDITVTPRDFRSKSVDWSNPVSGNKQLGEFRNTGSLAAELVAESRVSIEEYISHEFEGLDSFETAIDLTLVPDADGVFGPPQILVS